MSKELIGLTIELSENRSLIVDIAIAIRNIKDHGNALSARILARINKALVIEEVLDRLIIDLLSLRTREAQGISNHITRSSYDLIEVSVINHLRTRYNNSTSQNLDDIDKELIGTFLCHELIAIHQELLIRDTNDSILRREFLA